MGKHVINIYSDFGDNLGGRFRTLGSRSGEEFYESILLPKFTEAVSLGEKLYVQIDGSGPYGSSFLDQSFGELARNKGLEIVRENIVIETANLSWVRDFINTNIWAR